MKKLITLLFLSLTLLSFAACGAIESTTTAATTTTVKTTTTAAASSTTPSTTTTPITTEVTEVKLTSNEAIKAAREEAWESYLASLPESRKTELVKGKVTYITVRNRKMKVDTRVFGRKPDDGYPIYIVLHGGGSDPTGEMNESQWSGMSTRYTTLPACPGIYVACRAIEDTWNCHSVDGAYTFYDRIIENAVAFLGGNANKAYIVGYSAGGDGVYQIAPRMADRFAAANMTAGHPNGISMINMYNTPIYLQVGEKDSSYSRNTETVKYGNLLTSLAEKYGGGYIHDVFVHSNKEHGVVGDNATTKQTVVADLEAWLKSGGVLGTGGTKSVMTHASYLMSAHIRNPIPEKIVWDLSTRTPSARRINSFYWLSAPATVKTGELVIRYDKNSNSVIVDSCTIKKSTALKITVYLSEDMLDLFSDITFDFCGTKTVISPEVSRSLITKTTSERGDSNFQFAASFTFDTTGKVVATSTAD